MEIRKTTSTDCLPGAGRPRDEPHRDLPVGCSRCSPRTRPGAQHTAHAHLGYQRCTAGHTEFTDAEPSGEGRGSRVVKWKKETGHIPTGLEDHDLDRKETENEQQYMTQRRRLRKTHLLKGFR